MIRKYLLLISLSCLFCSQVQAEPIRALFDQGHGQAFTIENDGELQLGQLARIFRDQGWQVGSTVEPFTDEALRDVDALIISGAFKPFSADEIMTIADFVHDGGSLAIMIHVAPPLTSLLERFGITFANGVVREGDSSRGIAAESLNFTTTELADHPLNQGLPYFSLYGAWPLMPFRTGPAIIASTSSKAWVDLDRDRHLSTRDAVQKFGVLVAGTMGKGKFAVFGDDAIFQNRFLVAENQRLAQNLGRWLRP